MAREGGRAQGGRTVTLERILSAQPSGSGTGHQVEDLVLFLSLVSTWTDWYLCLQTQGPHLKSTEPRALQNHCPPGLPQASPPARFFCAYRVPQTQAHSS